LFSSNISDWLIYRRCWLELKLISLYEILLS
jgi:hypothetical protein